MQVPQPSIADTAVAGRRARGGNCLLSFALVIGCLLACGLTALGGALAGWNSGVELAQATALSAADAEIRQQCAMLPEDLAAGNLALAGARLQSLRIHSPPPDCLIRWSPLATQAWLDSLPSPTPPPTSAPAIAANATSPPSAVTLAPLSNAYDLDALLAQAQAELAARDYPAAIDTLDAVISLDADFQRETTRELMLQALTTQARALFEAGKLPEAIVLSERAEIYGDIGDLNFLREVAVMLQSARMHRSSNPAQAVSLLRRIVYDLQSPRLMTVDMVGELQAALAAYGDWLLPSNACAARDQYQAALDLQPMQPSVGHGSLSAKMRQAEQACPGAGTNSG